MTEILDRYCEITQTSKTEVLKKRTDRNTVAIRDALIYLTWEKEKPKACRKNKSLILTKIGEAFNMKRNSVHERIEKTQAEIRIYKGDETVERIRQMLRG